MPSAAADGILWTGDKSYNLSAEGPSAALEKRTKTNAFPIAPRMRTFMLIVAMHRRPIFA